MSDETQTIESANVPGVEGAAAPEAPVTTPSDGKKTSPSTEPETKPEPTVDLAKLQHDLDSAKGRISKADKTILRTERELSQTIAERDNYRTMLEEIENRELANWKGDEDGTAAVKLRQDNRKLTLENARLKAQLKTQDEMEEVQRFKDAITDAAITHGVDAKELREELEELGIKDAGKVERIARHLAPKGTAPAKEARPTKPSANVPTDSGINSGSTPTDELKQRYPSMFK